jgi:GxxExxY protein
MRKFIFSAFSRRPAKAQCGKNAKGIFMTENEISKTIVDACFRIHSKLGPGLFESVYERILQIELERNGLLVERQKVIPVVWDDEEIDQGFKADLIVESKVIIEIKSVEKLAPVHHKQLLTYMKLTGIKLGLLINFNEKLIKYGITRIVNNL